MNTQTHEHMIIDIHNHIGLSRDGGHGELDILISNMEEYGISISVVFATDEETTGATFENLNAKVIGAQKEYPDKIIAFARIVPSAGEKAIEEFNRCCREGVKGLKLKPTDGFEPREATIIFDLIDSDHFPVLIHTGHEPVSDPSLWEPFFIEYPKIDFILAHGGKDHYRKCAEIVKKYSNAYVDTTTLSYHRTKYLYDMIGPEKILFASDYPYSHPAVELKKFEVLVKDKGALEMILYKNSAKLLGL